nr:integrase, catalytic region, zinc finger, CCHC-type, peptidase aspartic, catalytic [Tanacetum cinerariifolium]
ANNNAFDDDVDEQPVQDLALNVDNVFQAEDCDAFDSDVDEAPTAQTMFMDNLSSADPITDEARPSYDLDILSENKVAIGYKNPLCLTRAKQAQPALYNGHEILKDNHAPAKVHNTEDTLETTEITRKKMNAKMIDPECVTHKRAKVSRPIKAFTMYPPNTQATLVPKVLPIKCQVKIHIFTLIQMFLEFDKICKKRITPTAITDGERGFEQTKACYLQEVIPFFKTIKDNFEGIQKALTKEVKEMKDVFKELEAKVAQCAVDRKHDAIDQKNLLIANDNLIAECLSKEVFFVATKSELNVARFTEMHVANTSFEVKDNDIRQLKNQLSKLQVTSSDTEHTAKLKISVSKAKVQPPVLTRTKHAVDVEPIVPRLRNNKDAHLDYLMHLKESVEIICDIVEEAKVLAHTPLIRKKQVTATKPSDKQDRVKSCPKASGSQPKSNPKTNRISPAKGANMLPVEDLPRTNKSHRRTTNHVDSSSRLKRTVGKVWKPTGKVLTTIGHQWRPTGRILHLGKQCPLTRFTPPQVVTAAQNKKHASCSKHMTGDRSRLLNFVKKFTETVRFGNDHFGAIMGYGDYVVSESVISRAQNDLFRAENDKIKQHYKELYDFIKITRAKPIEQVTKLTIKNMNLKTCVSKATVNPQVSARDKHAIDVEPIVPRLRNNRDAHLDYLRHLKESVETIRDIVEEAKVVRPLDRSIVSACRYTKHSQELLEKKQVTTTKPSDRQDSNKHKHVVTQKTQKTNVPVPHSTGVKSYIKASESQSKRNPKTNRISPAKGANKLPVEDLRRTNKYHYRTTNRVDSSSHLKRTVINSNLDCRTCNKFLASFDHDMCAATCVKSVVRPHSTRHNCEVKRKIKQVWKPKQVGKVWKPTGKVLTTIGHQLRPTSRILHLGKQCPLTRFTPPQVVSAAQNKKQARTCANQMEPNHNWGSKVSNVPSLSGFKCRYQLDEQWFVLTKDTLREALQITPINNTQAFVAPPSAESIHTFMEDKQNLSRHTTGKKRATLILIPSIRFTKLIIHHLQRRHKFHPRPDSALHLANDEPVLGYLKFNAKGTKREVFGMPIPGRLITADIREASYYQEYQENVAKYRGFMADETGSTQDLLAPKPAKPARKPKFTTQKAPLKPSISTLPRSSTKSVGASEAEEVPAVEPRVADEEADYQKAVEESLKTAHAVHQGPLPPVVIREPASGKYQSPLEVPGKGKAKVTEEQVSHDLLSLQKAKRKNLVEQYIFQRRIFEPTASSFHDESPYDVLGQSNSEEESKKVLTRASEGGNDDVQTGPDPDVQDEGQKETDADTLDEGQARPDPGITGNEEQSIPNPMVHAGSDREHMDLDVTKALPQPSTEQLDEGFLATAYPKIQESLKLAVEEQVLLEEPASSSGTLSSLHHLSKDISFGDQFFSDKPLDVDKNTETEVESMEHQQFKATTTDITTTTTTITIPPPQAQQQSTTEAMMVKRIGELKHILADLIQVNKNMEERLDKHGARLYTLEQLDIPQQHARKKRKRRESPKMPPGSPPHQPPPPPPPMGPSGAFGSQVTPSPPPPPPLSTSQDNLDMDEDMAPDEQAQSSDDEDIGSAHIQMVNLRQGWWKPFEEERPTTPEPAWSIRSSDVPVLTNNWASALASNYLPPPEDSLLAQTGPAYEIVKVFHPDVIHLQYQIEECHKLLTDSVDDPILRHNISRPLPLGGPPGQVIIQSDFFFNRDLEYLIYGSKGRRPALAVRTHIRILGVVRIEVFSIYGYDYMKKIVLHRADLNEHVIAERD